MSSRITGSPRRGRQPYAAPTAAKSLCPLRPLPACDAAGPHLESSSGKQSYISVQSIAHMRSRSSVITALAMLGLVGCGQRVIERETSDHGGDQLVTLSRMYTAAQRSLGRPPRGIDDLKTVAKEFGDLERLLTSPNDGQPYAIVWGVDLGNAPNPTMVVAHEKLGVGGVRYVMTPTGVMKLTDQEFDRASFPPGYKPPAR
jgi:hypothetical protein